MCFTKAVVNNKAVNLANLPPTAVATRQQFYRVYLQVQQWLSNDLPPENWGWIHDKTLIPKMMSNPPAPKNLLELIFCNCNTSSCGKACGCRKADLFCSVVCRYCEINGCTNFSQIVGESAEDDIGDDDEDQNETLIRNVDDEEAANEIDEEF